MWRIMKVYRPVSITLVIRDQALRSEALLWIVPVSSCGNKVAKVKYGAHSQLAACPVSFKAMHCS
jgi:hypothetical protein